MHSHWSDNHQRDWQWNRNLDHALKIPSKKFSRNTSLQTQMHKFTKQKNTTRKSHLKIKIIVNDKGNKRRQEKYLEKKIRNEGLKRIKDEVPSKKTYKQQNFTWENCEYIDSSRETNKFCTPHHFLFLFPMLWVIVFVMVRCTRICCIPQYK